MRDAVVVDTFFRLAITTSSSTKVNAGWLAERCVMATSPGTMAIDG
jgi:hypothetical protein